MNTNFSTTPLRTPKVGVGVLVIREGTLLLGKRRGAHGAATWAAPGGKLDYGEGVLECAKRELFEETGLTLEEAQVGPYTNDVMEGDEQHYVTLFVLVTHASGNLELKEPDKCDGWHWFSLSDLPSPLFKPLSSVLSLNYLQSA